MPACGTIFLCRPTIFPYAVSVLLTASRVFYFQTSKFLYLTYPYTSYVGITRAAAIRNNRIFAKRITTDEADYLKSFKGFLTSCDQGKKKDFAYANKLKDPRM